MRGNKKDVDKIYDHQETHTGISGVKGTFMWRKENEYRLDAHFLSRMLKGGERELLQQAVSESQISLL